jgi:hypothetical protein
MKLWKGSAIAFAFLALGAAFLMKVPDARAAFGISPPFFNADHLVPGITYSQTIYLVQDQPNEDLPIKAALTISPDIASWISIDKGFNFFIPKGTRQFPIVISAHVPNGQGIGKWSGNLAITSQPAQTGQVAIALGANVGINLTVGAGIFEKFSIPLITFPAIEEGWSPKVAVKFVNEGNIAEAFDGATMDISDQYDTVRLAYAQKDSGFPKTEPFSTSEYTFDFPISFHLGVGEYWGNVVFYKDRKIVASQKTIFHVLPAGSIAGIWGRIGNFFNTNPWMNYFGIILLVIILFFITLRFKRSRRAA